MWSTQVIEVFVLDDVLVFMLDISYVHAVNFKSRTCRSFYTFTVYTFLKHSDLDFGPASSLF